MPIPDAEFDKAQRLAFEKEMLGLYVSDHPLRGYEAALARHTDADASRTSARTRCPPATAPRAHRRRGGDRPPAAYTKKGDLMARFVLEDLQAAMEVFVFPKTMAEYGAWIENDAVIVVKGRLDPRDEQPKSSAWRSGAPFSTGAVGAAHLSSPSACSPTRRWTGLKEVLGGHPGPSPVLLHVGEKVLRLPPEFNVDCRSGLVGRTQAPARARAPSLS